MFTRSVRVKSSRLKDYSLIKEEVSSQSYSTLLPYPSSIYPSSIYDNTSWSSDPSPSKIPKVDHIIESSDFFRIEKKNEKKQFIKEEKANYHVYFIHGQQIIASQTNEETWSLFLGEESITVMGHLIHVHGTSYGSFGVFSLMKNGLLCYYKDIDWTVQSLHQTNAVLELDTFSSTIVQLVGIKDDHYLIAALENGQVIVISYDIDRERDTVGLKSSRLGAHTTPNILQSIKSKVWGEEEKENIGRILKCVGTMKDQQMEIVVLGEEYSLGYDLTCKTRIKWKIPLKEYVAQALEKESQQLRFLTLLHCEHQSGHLLVAEFTNRMVYHLIPISFLQEAPYVQLGIGQEIVYQPQILDNEQHKVVNVQTYINKEGRMALLWPKMEPVQITFLSFSDGKYHQYHLESKEIIRSDNFITAAIVEASEERSSLSFCVLQRSGETLYIMPTCWSPFIAPPSLRSSNLFSTSRTKKLQRDRENLKCSSVEECIGVMVEQWKNKRCTVKFSVEETAPFIQESVLSIAKNLLDANPSTGVHWGGQKHRETGGMLPQLVQFQLEEKWKNYGSLIQFLSQHPDHLFDALDLEAKTQLHENAEKLCGALALCRLQSQCSNAGIQSSRMNGHCLLQAMQIVVELRNHSVDQLRNSGLSVCDAFFSKISLLDQLFPALQVAVQRTEDLHVETLIESSVAIYSIIDAAVQYRKECNFKSLNNMWTTSLEVRIALRDTVLCNLTWIGYTSGDSETSLHLKCALPLVKELGEQTMAIGRLLLDGYSEHSMEKWELDAYEDNKALILNPLVCIGCHVGYDKVYSMCETYHYYVGLFECIMKMNITSTHLTAQQSKAETALIECCSQFTSESFYYQLFRYFGGEMKNPWSGGQGTSTPLRLAMLFALPQRFKAQLQEYLMSSSLSHFAWVNALSSDMKFAEVNLLLQAQNEETHLTRKRCFLSLGKMATKAGIIPNDEEPSTSLDAYNAELKILEIQQQLARRPEFQVVELNSVMNIFDFVNIALQVITENEHASLPSTISTFVSLLSILEQVAFLASKKVREDPEKVRQFILEIWFRILALDANLWKEITEDFVHLDFTLEKELENVLTTTILFNVLTHYVSDTKETSFVLLNDKLVEEMVNSDFPFPPMYLTKTIQLAALSSTSKQRLNNSSNEKGISSSQYQRGSFTARKERSLREAVQIKLKQTKTSLAGVVENLNPKMESLYGLIKRLEKENDQHCQVEEETRKSFQMFQQQMEKMQLENNAQFTFLRDVLTSKIDDVYEELKNEHTRIKTSQKEFGKQLLDMETQVDILKENVNGTRQTIKIQLDNTHQEMVHLRTLGADIIQQESTYTRTMEARWTEIDTKLFDLDKENMKFRMALPAGLGSCLESTQKPTRFSGTQSEKKILINTRLRELQSSVDSINSEMNSRREADRIQFNSLTNRSRDIIGRISNVENITNSRHSSATTERQFITEWNSKLEYFQHQFQSQVDEIKGTLHASESTEKVKMELNRIESQMTENLKINLNSSQNIQSRVEIMEQSFSKQVVVPVEKMEQEMIVIFELILQQLKKSNTC